MSLSIPNALRHWPEAILTVFGLTAVTAVAMAVFDSSPPDLIARRCGSYEPPDAIEVSGDAAWAAAQIEALGTEAVPALLDRVERQGEISYSAIGVFGRLGPDAVPLLVEALHDPCRDVRLVVIRILGALGPGVRPCADVLMPSLIELLRDGDGEIRLAAISLLGRVAIGRVETLPALIRALRIDDSDLDENAVEVRFKAVHMLGKIGPPAQAAVPQLRALLGVAHNGTRKQALEALKRIQRVKCQFE